jgi:hypothetical protein
VISKKTIISLLKNKLEQDLTAALEVEKTLESFKTQDDMLPESKYDTRSTEAGYLSTAHQKRLFEIRRDITLCQNFTLKQFLKTEEIALGALVLVEIGNTQKLIFLCQFLGGFEIKVEDNLIHVVTINSPLGIELIGLKINDEFEFHSKGKIQNYKIISIE